MKKIIAFLALAIVLYSCKSGSAGSPTATVKSFIEAAKSGNLEEVKKCISKSDVSMLEIGQSFLAKVNPDQAQQMKDKMAEKFREGTKDAKIDIGDEKIDGTNATVNVSFVHDGQTREQPFSLVKEDGQWKISLISTGMNSSGISQEEKDKAMQFMNSDSLGGVISKGMEEFNKLDKDSLKNMINEAMKQVNGLDKDSLRNTIKRAMKEVDKIGNDSLKKAMEQGLKELDKLKDLPKKN